jgi:MFS transporter, ACS family, tartrate transporter
LPQADAQVSTSRVMLLVVGCWMASQIQRFSLAAYVGASGLMVDLGITAAAAGFLAAVYFPVYGSLQIPSGILADQGNPRVNILIGSTGMVAAGLAFAFAPSFELAVVGLSSGLLWLSLIRIMWLLPGRAYARRISTTIAVGAIGQIASLGLLPTLIAVVGWRVVAGIVVLPTFVVALLLLTTPLETRAATADLGELWSRAVATLRLVPAILARVEFWVVFLPNMLWMGTQFAVLTWLPRYARDIVALPDAAVGILPALVPVGQIAGSVGFGWLQARRPRLGLPLFFATAVLYVGAMALLTFGIAEAAGELALFTLAMTLGFLYGSFFISIAWVSGVVEPKLLATATGVMNGLGFLPAFVLPWLMGLLMDAHDRPPSPAWHYSPGAYALAFGLAGAALAAGLVGSGLVRLYLDSRRQGAPDTPTATERS